jgi:hypothetical protein
MCDTCVNFVYDEEEDWEYCAVDMDEDDYVRLVTSPRKVCPFYRNGDEYAVVRHQM